MVPEREPRLQEEPVLEEPVAESGGTALDQDRLLDGESFVFSESVEIAAAWGERGQVAWAEGEPVMIVGPDGVGKTTIGQQLTRRRLGLGAPELLGMPVAVTGRRLLYIAADRPRQAARSFRRMSHEDDRGTLRERLVVWRGPLPFDLASEPKRLAAFTASHGADTIVIDSLKDVATDLVKDEVGSRVSLAFQEVIAAGIELCVLHHQRKEQQGAARPRRLADVYGSRWLTACMGSVLLVWGEPGDLVVELTHLKQPAEDVGPLKVIHDHVRGSSSLYEPADLETVLGRATAGLSVSEAAQALFETSGTPSPNQREKARRRLEALARDGRADRRDDPDGSARYFTREQAA